MSKLFYAYIYDPETNKRLTSLSYRGEFPEDIIPRVSEWIDYSDYVVGNHFNITIAERGNPFNRIYGKLIDGRWHTITKEKIPANEFFSIKETSTETPEKDIAQSLMSIADSLRSIAKSLNSEVEILKRYF